MATQAKSAIPAGYHSLTPYLACKGAAKAIDWYRSVLGAEELFRMPGEHGMVRHAELRIGDSVVMLADEFPDMGHLSPQSLGGTPVGLMLYVEQSDAVFDSAVAAGATVAQPMTDQFYGDRSGTIVDPFGHRWTIATNVEEMTPEELERRMAALTPKGAEKK